MWIMLDTYYRDTHANVAALELKDLHASTSMQAPLIFVGRANVHWNMTMSPVHFTNANCQEF